MRQNQKPAVCNDPWQAFPPPLGTPSDPGVPDGDLPGRTREGSGSHHPFRPASDQIANLGPAERSRPQIMVPDHEVEPKPGKGFVRRVHPDEVDLPQIRKRSGNHGEFRDWTDLRGLGGAFFPMLITRASGRTISPFSCRTLRASRQLISLSFPALFFQSRRRQTSWESLVRDRPSPIISRILMIVSSPNSCPHIFMRTIVAKIFSHITKNLWVNVRPTRRGVLKDFRLEIDCH